MEKPSSNSGPTVALFATCLVNLMRPVIGFASLRLLEDAGCRVSVPPDQTCCGQPNYNAGDSDAARAAARRFIETFEGFDYVVAPSGSCAGMVRLHYPPLFDADDPWHQRADDLAARTFELTSFLVDVMGVTSVAAHHQGAVTYHDACAGLRELGVRHQPRTLLETVEGLSVAEMPDGESCCGFGGTFSVKYPAISEKIVDAKVDAVNQSGAKLVLGGDLGCLMNIAGRLKRRGSDITVRHVAEVLAGATDDAPPIGDAASED